MSLESKPVLLGDTFLSVIGVAPNTDWGLGVMKGKGQWQSWYKRISCSPFLQTLSFFFLWMGALIN